jgi:hypothetical protein
MEAFKDAVGLRSFHAGHAMGNILKLRDQLMGVLIRPAAEFIDGNQGPSIGCFDVTPRNAGRIAIIKTA